MQNLLTRLKDWKTTGVGTALTLLIGYACPDLYKDLMTPQGLMTAMVAVGPAILGALSHSSQGKSNG